MQKIGMLVLLSLGILTNCSERKLAQRNLKREFRAVWITTFDHMDFPTEKGAPPRVHKKELVDLLNFHQRNGINAIFFQVRPASDAFYKSNIELWSQWLTGEQGQAPSPGWDPLTFLVEECHRRNMELHAWINPYRAVYNVKYDDTHPQHITKTHPEWFVVYGKHKQFNPGIPAVQRYLTRVVADIASRYDVDGIHFDDYFYPYKKGKLRFPDETTFQKHSGTTRNIHNWRRQNVDQLIKRVHDTLQNIKPYLKFGVSPFGVWRNKAQDKIGSDTKAQQTSYDALYADVLKWLRKGWIDYVAPQLYWRIGHPRANYSNLVKWWANHAYGRHVYIGHAFYKVGENKQASWKTGKELPNQIRLSRQYPRVMGNAYFRSRFLQKNPAHMTDTLRQYVYRHLALIPRMPWKTKSYPNEPRNAFIMRETNKISLRWKPPLVTISGDTAAYYVVYRFPASLEAPDFSQPRYIRSITRKQRYEETVSNFGKQYYYGVSAVGRLHNESLPVTVK